MIIRRNRNNGQRKVTKIIQTKPLTTKTIKEIRAYDSTESGTGWWGVGVGGWGGSEEGVGVKGGGGKGQGA